MKSKRKKGLITDNKRKSQFWLYLLIGSFDRNSILHDSSSLRRIDLKFTKISVTQLKIKAQNSLSIELSQTCKKLIS